MVGLYIIMRVKIQVYCFVWCGYILLLSTSRSNDTDDTGLIFTNLCMNGTKCVSLAISNPILVPPIYITYGCLLRWAFMCRSIRLAQSLVLQVNYRISFRRSTYAFSPARNLIKDKAIIGLILK